MIKYLIVIIAIGGISCTAMAEFNCCGKCPFNQTQPQCTEMCCSGIKHSETDIGNGVIQITDKSESVTCATSSSGTNLVRCVTTYTYKCKAGYYGNPTALNKTCTKCPNSGTSSEGSISITKCYIPSGTTGSDSTGSYTYTANCYYSN